MWHMEFVFVFADQVEVQKMLMMARWQKLFLGQEQTLGPRCEHMVETARHSDRNPLMTNGNNVQHKNPVEPTKSTSDGELALCQKRLRTKERRNL